jgi:Ca-activated chloride channel family protein
MFRFEYIEHFFYLGLLCPIALAFGLFMYWRSSAIKKLGQANLLERLMPGKPRYKHQVKFVLLFLAFAALVIAYANPQMGSKYEKIKRKGIDLIVALDVSNSMLAEDVKPDRLQRSKQFISRLLEKLQNDRVGLVIFAGHAYTQVPITIDYSATKLLLNTVNPSMVPTQGTAIGEAIEMAMRSYNTEDKKHKALVIITDGEDHEPDALETVEEATKQGIVIYTIGVGDPKGAPIPEYRDGVQADFKRDKQGNIVLSKLNETMLQQIAVKGNGKYYRMVSGTTELDQLVTDISGMEKKEQEERVVTDYESQYQYFIIFALILLTLEFIISERKSTWLQTGKLFK